MCVTNVSGAWATKPMLRFLLLLVFNTEFRDKTIIGFSIKLNFSNHSMDSVGLNALIFSINFQILHPILSTNSLTSDVKAFA